jgi:hypothetical protein
MEHAARTRPTMGKLAMTFRVGLLFHSRPRQPFVMRPVFELLQKLDTKSKEVRKDQLITLVPFVRTAEMVVFSKSVADTGGYAVEAFAFDEGGVTCGSLDVFNQLQHVAYDQLLDFDLGMKVLLSRCDVIAIVSQDVSEFTQIRERLAMFHNTSVLVVLIAAQSQQNRFIEVDPLPKDKDGPSWLLAVTERWEQMGTAPDPVPKRKRTVLGLLFPIFNSAIIRRWSETLKKLKKPTEAEQCEAGLGLSLAAKKKTSSPDNCSLQMILDSICPHFVRHDELGRHYSNVFKTTCLLVPFLIVVSTILAIGAALDSGRQDVWHISEGLLLITAAMLFLRSRIAQHHRRWVEHRLLTELLRPAMLSALFQMLPQLTPPSEEPKLWIDQSRILLRHLRALPTVVFDSDVEDLRSARISAIDDFSSYQARWHKDFAGQHRAAETRLSRMSAHAFVATLCLCALQLVIASVIKSLADHPEVMVLYGEGIGRIGQVLLMGTLISAGSAFVILILSHQLGFEAIAERSSNAAEHFEELQNEITRSGYTVDARQAYAWADKCAGAILAEQHSWYRQIPMIRMHI